MEAERGSGSVWECYVDGWGRSIYHSRKVGKDDPHFYDITTSGRGLRGAEVGQVILITVEFPIVVIVHHTTS